MDISPNPARYFRDAAGAAVTLSALGEVLTGGDHRIHLEMHRLGWHGSLLQHRSPENKIAELTATVGAVDARRAICICQIWIRRDAPTDSTVELLLREFLEQARKRVGEHEILGAVVETGSGDPPELALRRRGYRFHADLGQHCHHPVPRLAGSELWRKGEQSYVEVPDPGGNGGPDESTGKRGARQGISPNCDCNA